ncbi:MAG: family 20 glycosylhydrolase [Clostridia bacterium]|nr:family 20 glycosylhydrolase [Clostridia bacterium]
MKFSSIYRIFALLLCLCLLWGCGADPGGESGYEDSAEPGVSTDESFADSGYESVADIAELKDYVWGMKSFTAADGTLCPTGISVNSENAALKARVEALFDAGDTALTLSLDESFTVEGVADPLVAQAYKIEVGDSLAVTARTEAGLYYGARTVSDYIAVQGGMNKGVYLDWPDVDERCLHFDIARKYYEKDFIIGMIEQAAAMKLNAVELHFSENEGFRIECETEPAIVSDKYLTKDEVREILAAAKELYVEIIPSFDSPGHLMQALSVHPEYTLTDVDGYNSPKTLDITNPKAVAYIKSLLDEYAELFSECKKFNIGGDESFGWSDVSRMQFSAWKVLENYAKATYGEGANAHDAFVGYINDIADHMMKKGFTVRAWNDGLMRTRGQAAVVKPDPDIEICYWTTGGALRADGVDAFIEAGHRVYNVNEGFVYYVLKEDFEQPSAKEIWKDWDGAVFTDGEADYKSPEELGDRLAGAYFCIWSDKPNTQTSSQVKKDSARAMAALAVKSWSTKPQISYTDFTAQFKKLIEG